MAGKKIRVGLVGAGHVAQVAHIPAYRQNPHVELVAVVDGDPEKARHIQEQNGFAEWYEDFSDMLGRADIDAVDICTPNYLHAPMAIAALRSGRDVLCEKPIARNMREAERMVETAREHGRTLMVAMNNRFREDVRTLHDVVKDKELGDVHFAKVGFLRNARDLNERAWFTEQGKAGGGALLDLGTPLLDMVMWISGLRRPVAVSCSTFGKKGPGGVEESACAMLRFGGGACVMLEVSWNLREPRTQSYLHVHGSKGAAMLNPLTVHKAIHGVLVNVTPATGSGRHHYKESYRLEIDHFVECLLKQKTPLTSGRDALLVVSVMDALYESASTGREVEFTA